MMSSQVVRVKREKLELCMTCPLCNSLLDDATTISECLHTFCRRCIYEKITDDEVDSCPVCNRDLGCTPLEKLRADHNLQDLRAKIFPSPKTNVAVDEAALPAPTPARRKERSLSSLVVIPPKVPSQTGITGKRTKSSGRKVPGLRDPAFFIDEPSKTVKDHPESSSSPETLSKFTQNRRLNHISTAESSKQHMPDASREGVEAWVGKADLWKPLNCLVEAASRTKSAKSNSQGSPHLPDHDTNAQKLKVRERSCKRKIQDDENGPLPACSSSLKPRKSNGVRQKKNTVSEGLNITAQAVVDAASTRCVRRVGPIWFSLVASNDQEGDAPLPQISSHFLRIMDDNMPVSFIKRYLVKKLDLQSESEVQITLQGQPLLSTVLLHDLVDWWSQTIAKPERVAATVGASAKDFVMVLSYGRKPHHP